MKHKCFSDNEGKAGMAAVSLKHSLKTDDLSLTQEQIKAIAQISENICPLMLDPDSSES